VLQATKNVIEGPWPSRMVTDEGFIEGTMAANNVCFFDRF
jgi:hypothetical protein